MQAIGLQTAHQGPVLQSVLGAPPEREGAARTQPSPGPLSAEPERIGSVVLDAAPCRRQAVNHFPGSYGIGRKDYLWRNLSRMQRQHGERSRPLAASLVPVLSGN